jgi:RimJ/RimL family protein N-acetyltransferase
VLRPDYPLRTPRLTLRPFRAGDLDDLRDIQSREDVARYLYWSPRGRDEVRESLKTKVTQSAIEDEGDVLAVAVELTGTGRVVGDVILAWRSREYRQGEVGFVFHPDWHGRGFAAEATRVVLALGFDGLGLHRIAGRCDARNTASARLMRRLGMRREAHFVQNEFVKGEWCDELVYAVLAEEWRAQDRPHVHMLPPVQGLPVRPGVRENFAVEGEQAGEPTAGRRARVDDAGHDAGGLVGDPVSGQAPDGVGEGTPGGLGHVVQHRGVEHDERRTGRRLRGQRG